MSSNLTASAKIKQPAAMQRVFCRPSGSVFGYTAVASTDCGRNAALCEKHIMIGLLVITHETLGTAYTAIARHFFPDADTGHIRLLPVQDNFDHADVLRRAHALIEDFSDSSGVLIMTDIFGATPCNAAMKLVRPGRSAIITGLNVPMLIRAFNRAPQADDLAAFAESVKEAGMAGIMTFTEAPV